MKITKNVISREAAVAMCPDYVAFIEAGAFEAGDGVFGRVMRQFEILKRGQQVVTARDTGDPNRPKHEFVLAKVSSINHNDPRAVDGPIVRVTNDEYSWRCDGDHYAWAVAGVLEARKAVDAVLANH